MALVPCAECGNAVSTLATACPKCGAPRSPGVADDAPSSPPPESTDPGWGRLFASLGAAILAVLLVAAIATKSSGGASSKSSEPALLHGSIGYLDTQFIVTNKEDFALRNCALNIQMGGMSGIYTLHGVDFPAHGERIIEANEFTNFDSERFNPFTHKPKNLNIECESQSGKVAGGREWDW